MPRIREICDETRPYAARARAFLGFALHARSLTLLLAALASVAAGVIASSPIYASDVFWVAAAGRQILLSGGVPRQNLFSFTEPDHPWVMHEWLLGPVYALGLERWGPAFFPAFTLLIFGGGLTLLLKGTLPSKARSTTILAQAALPGARVSAGLLLAIFGLGVFGSRLLSARPSGVAMLFPLALSVIAFSRRFTRLRALAATALGLLWANTHGSFPLGAALLLLSALEARSDRVARWLACAGFSLATWLTPHGLALHRLVFEYSRGQTGIFREIHEDVNEFHGLIGAWGVTTGPTDVLGLLAMGALALHALARPGSRLRGVFCLLLVALSVVQARHIELAGLLSVVLLAPSAAELFPRALRALGLADEGAQQLDFSRTARVVVGTALGVGALALGVRRQNEEPAAFLNQGPAFLDVLSAASTPARLYAPFTDAALAIWYGFPREIRVFYDPRNDCYSPSTFRAFAALGDPKRSPRELREILSSTRTDAALVRGDHTLARLLREEPDWKLSVSQGPYRLFERQVPRLGQADRAGTDRER